MFDKLRSALVSSGVCSERDALIFMRVLGIDGHPGESLRKAANTHDLSSERVRQICDRIAADLAAQLDESPHFTAVREILKEATAALDRCVPTTDESATAELIARRLLDADGGMASSVVRAARLILNTQHVIVDTWGTRTVIIGQGTPRCYSTVASLARKIAASSGAVSIKALQAAYAKTGVLSTADARTMLECCGSILCVDDDLWFHFPEGGSDAITRAEGRVGSFGSCSLKNLVEASHRVTRSQYNIQLPMSVMAALLVAHGFDVDGDTVTKKSGSIGRLSDVQQEMVKVLKQLGGRARSAEYVKACTRNGINSSTARVYLRRSGLFQLKDGHYMIAQ